MLFALVVSACSPGSGEGREVARAAVEDSIETHVEPLQSEVDGLIGPETIIPLQDKLRSSLTEVDAPDGVRQLRPTGEPWGQADETENGDRYVGTGVLVLRDDPGTEAFCVGVTLDNDEGVVFTRNIDATAENECAGLDPHNQP